MLGDGGKPMPLTLRVVLRGVISFATLLILARALGKQQLSQLSFFEYITGISIGSIAGALTVDLGSQAWVHWVGLCTWAGLTLLVQALSLRSRKFAAALAGVPEVIISHGRILEANMRRNRYRFEDLFTELRQQGVFDMNEVEFAVLETTGKLSVMRKGTADMQNLPSLLVQEGEVLHANLRAAGRDESWLHAALQQAGVGADEVGRVTVAVLSPSGNLYVDTRKDS